jgi:hypothetical protein
VREAFYLGSEVDQDRIDSRDSGEFIALEPLAEGLPGIFLRNDGAAAAVNGTCGTGFLLTMRLKPRWSPACPIAMTRLVGGPRTRWAAFRNGLLPEGMILTWARLTERIVAPSLR